MKVSAVAPSTAATMAPSRMVLGIGLANPPLESGGRVGANRLERCDRRHRPARARVFMAFPSARPPCSFLGPFLALRLSRIIKARLRTLAADPFEKAYCENNAWRATHVTGIARRGPAAEPRNGRFIFDEHTAHRYGGKGQSEMGWPFFVRPHRPRSSGVAVRPWPPQEQSAAILKLASTIRPSTEQPLLLQSPPA